MMPAKRLYTKSDFKCPKCGYECFYLEKDNIYVCNRPMVLSTGLTGGSCGRFIKKGKRLVNEKIKRNKREDKRV